MLRKFVGTPLRCSTRSFTVKSHEELVTLPGVTSGAPDKYRARNVRVSVLGPLNSIRFVLRLPFCASLASAAFLRRRSIRVRSCVARLLIY
jgi:hypothetical protein